MGAHRNLDAVGAAFTEAALDPTRWTAAMDAAAEATGSAGATLLPLRGRLPEVPVSESIGAAAEDYIRNGWIHRDERFRGMDALLPSSRSSISRRLTK